MRRDERPQQPAPDRALVIGHVAASLIPDVLSYVGRMVLSQAAQPVRRQEVTGTDIHDDPLPVRAEGTGRQRHHEDLIRPQGRIIPFLPVQHVTTSAQTIVPNPFKPGFLKYSQASLL